MPAAEPTITFTPIGWDELAEKYQGAKAEILYGMTVAFRRMSHPVKEELKANTPQAVNKKLWSATASEIMEEGTDKLRMEVRQSAWNKTYPYGVGVRMGTRPHWVPYKVLIPWVELKWEVSGREAKQAAYFLARKIERVGTRANDYHIRSIETIRPIAVNIITEEVEKIVKRIRSVSAV